ncbi:hypothetical protein NQ314_002207 [Rhamnusium bicolor]|uniref:Serine aminopeptidase S33 domain-containing protein n=1 Tax=Rhamnusium bicolor TaxID=1586634 RepID=A0AAV8ZQ12_9CUCU|nr:hypothetical protein NQ314_002207 [Rhamnusium bicolor]
MYKIVLNIKIHFNDIKHILGVMSPKNYSKTEAFGIKGVKNFYVDLKNEDNITLGVWQILPNEILSEVIENDDYNYDGALTNGNYNILLYMHGNAGDRATALELYDLLRKYYHIFAVDYRGYADSSCADMTETSIVGDMVEFYKWLRNRSNSSIFVWGHSLGTGIGTQLIANLKKENISSHGLILETPFTSVTDVMKTHPIIKLYNIAVNNRNTTYQGNITYHLFEELGYDHMSIFKAPELSAYIR